jgi:hypothetical protein
MSATLRTTTLVLGAVVTVILLTAWSPVVGDDKEDVQLLRRLEALARRLETVEKTLGARLGESGGRSIADRVTTLERGLGELSRATGNPRWSSPSTNLRELERSLSAAERQRAGIESRLRQLERDLHDASACARELRSMRNTLDSLRRSLRDVESRVRRLESRP